MPEEINRALAHLNFNFVTELRLRRGQPVIIGYKGEYEYLGACGLSSSAADRIISGDLTSVLSAATGGSVYNYTEQMKNGFITVGHGVRIGIAGEYVTEGSYVTAVKCVTSLNVRIPHDIVGCADKICRTLYKKSPQSTLIFSKPGLGKTTMLRDISRTLSRKRNINLLVFDERNEIAAMDSFGDGFALGAVDVVRSFGKIGALPSAIRAMKPDVILTDELYGENDLKAVKYAADCGICVIASSHVTDKEILKTFPFEYFVKLTSIGGTPEIYDKNFIAYCDGCVNDAFGSVPFGG
ncbi:MAG: hypothetical protein K2I20_03195 [Clostridia bacterium]|nr:hypothetical protein [Clostridia bacterium]